VPATVVVVYDKNVNRKRRNFTPVVMEEKHRGSFGALCVFAPCETRRAADSALKVEQQPCSFVQQRRTNKRRIVETGVSEIRCSNRKTRRVYTLYIYIYCIGRTNRIPNGSARRVSKSTYRIRVPEKRNNFRRRKNIRPDSSRPSFPCALSR